VGSAERSPRRRRTPAAVLFSEDARAARSDDRPGVLPRSSRPRPDRSPRPCL